MNEQAMRSNLRAIVRGAYDVQNLRIQAGNRIVANFKAKMGVEPGKKESEELDAEGKMILNNLRVHYRKITDGVARFPRQASFKGDEIISTYTELCLIAHYIELDKHETEHFNRLKSVLKEYAIYTNFLEDVKGVGPRIAGAIISEIDISRAKYASSLWKYAGLDVAEDGAGRSRRKEHLVEQEYTAKDGTTKIKVGITFNPWLKTKLIGVLGPSFIKAGDNKYSKIYRQYKHRLENHDKYKDDTKLHRHNMAVRYMVKRFLVDLYVAWRTIEGLPVHPEYHEAKLGHKH